MKIIRVSLLCIVTSLPICAQQPNRVKLAHEVKAEFLHAWNGYKKYARGHDDLKPLSKTYHDWYAEPLLMTPVDALDTMMLMGLKDEFATTHHYVVDHLSFDKDISVQNFEVTIRLLGGLLTNYQLTGDKRLLDLAEDLGKSRAQMMEDLLAGRTKFHNVFHYPTYSWGDVGVIAWLVDAAAILSQKALLGTSYAPYARTMQRICWEESFHIKHGYDIVVTLAAGTDAQRAMMQDALVPRAWGETGYISPLAPKQPHFPAKAKRIIYLFMAFWINLKAYILDAKRNPLRYL